MAFAKFVKPGSKIDLGGIDPEESGGLDKETGLAKLAKLGARIGELQELLFASGKNGLLIVMQGRDTAGKDGSINRILSYVNVQSCQVAAFKVPTPKELTHDFLWRVHQETPGKGAISVFNRSHYEDVLVVRVHELAPKEIWKPRYEHINNFERNLVDGGTIIVKFCLHISKEEQEKRLLEREQDPSKGWKLSVGDWKERDFWDDYTAAYNDALSKCSTEYAPWRVVSANKKWFRDLAIAEALVEVLEPYEKGWLEHLNKIGETAKADLAAFRAAPKPT